MRIDEIFESERLDEFDKRHLYYDYQIAKNLEFQKAYQVWKKKRSQAALAKISHLVQKITNDKEVSEYFVDKISKGKFDLEKSLNPAWKSSNDKYIASMKQQAAQDRSKNEPQTVYKPKPAKGWRNFLQPSSAS